MSKRGAWLTFKGLTCTSLAMGRRRWFGIMTFMALIRAERESTVICSPITDFLCSCPITFGMNFNFFFQNWTGKFHWKFLKRGEVFPEELNDQGEFTCRMTDWGRLSSDLDEIIIPFARLQVCTRFCKTLSCLFNWKLTFPVFHD